MASLPIKIHGGKDHLASKIISLFPKRYLTFCEPFFGAGNIMLRLDPEGHSEVANDVNRNLCNFWESLQSDSTFQMMIRKLEAIPFSEEEFKYYQMLDLLKADACSAAVATFVIARMSLAGRGKQFTPISVSRVRRGMNEQVSAWLSAIEGLPAVHARLRRVLILNEDFEDCIKKIDHKKTLFYCDPPYLHETRKTVSEYGEYEMDRDAHERLINCLAAIEGKFVLSGYRSEMYDKFAKRNKWKRVEFRIKNSAAGGKVKREMVECCWMNY